MMIAVCIKVFVLFLNKGIKRYSLHIDLKYDKIKGAYPLFDGIKIHKL